MSIVLTFLIAILTIYLPGILFFRILSSNYVLNITIAPIFSLGCYLIIPILFDLSGINASWIEIVSSSSLVGLFALIAYTQLSKRKKVGLILASCIKPDKTDRIIVLLAICISSLFMLCLYFNGFEDLGDFNQQYDNYTHLSLAQNYVETNQFSMLNTRYVPYSSPFYVSTTTNYPPMWHIVCALIASGSGTTVPIAANVFNFVICSFIFPTGIFIFLKTVANKKTILIAGAVISTAFASFPAGFIFWGPLSPNLLSFALSPLLIALFAMLATEKKSLSTKMAITFLIIALTIIIIQTQPNAVFLTAIFIIPMLCNWVVFSNLRQTQAKSKRIFAKGLLIALIISVSISMWIFFYKAPFMQITVSGNWPVFSTRPEALVDLLTFGMTEQIAPQPLLGVLVMVGIFGAIARKRLRWLVAPFLIASVIYIGGIPSEGFARHFFTGFWYTDPYRVAAIVCITAIPLSAIGLGSIYDMIGILFHKLFKAKTGRLSDFFSAILSLLFLLICYYPIYLPNHYGYNTAFGTLMDGTLEKSSLYYTPEEKSFIERAKERIEDDALIFNDPFDGSGYLYGADGVKSAIPFYLRYDASDEDNPINLLRKHIDEYTSNEEILNMLKEANVKYLLLLDVPQEGSDLSREWNISEPQNYDEMLDTQTIKGWEGLYSINEETPGFELILSENDMRLYKLTEV